LIELVTVPAVSVGVTTLAALTDPLAVQSGTNALALAYDEGTLYRSNGTTWVRASNGGDELAYAEKIDGSFTATTAENRKEPPSMSTITFDVIAGQVVQVEAVCGWHTCATIGGSASIFITDNAGVSTSANIKAVGIGPAAYQSAATKLGTLRAVERITAAGTYTRKVQVQSIVGTCTFQAGDPAAGIPPLWIQARTLR
jgi:hypothetical protein